MPSTIKRAFGNFHLGAEDAVIASVVALMLYLATAIPEAITGHGLIGRGLISKGVMVGLILGRAVMNRLYHNMMAR